MADDFKGRGGSPWESPPGGGGNGSGRGPAPPNIEEIIEIFKKQLIDLCQAKGPKVANLYF